MTTPSEPRAEDLRDDQASPPVGDPDNADLALSGNDLSQGAEPTPEAFPGELPDESQGPA